MRATIQHRWRSSIENRTTTKCIAHPHMDRRKSHRTPRPGLPPASRPTAAPLAPLPPQPPARSPVTPTTHRAKTRRAPHRTPRHARLRPAPPHRRPQPGPAPTDKHHTTRGSAPHPHETTTPKRTTAPEPTDRPRLRAPASSKGREGGSSLSGVSGLGVGVRGVGECGVFAYRRCSTVGSVSVGECAAGRGSAWCVRRCAVCTRGVFAGVRWGRDPIRGRAIATTCQRRTRRC